MEDTIEKINADASQDVSNLGVVGVKIRGNNKLLFYKTGGLLLQPGDKVVVTTDKGIDVAHVHFTTEKPQDVESLKTIIREANSEDLEKMSQNEAAEREARAEAQKMANEMKLPMEFVAGTFTLDKSKVTLYFLAEKRIDFREYVRELSKKVHAKVELWQIGQRDETRLFGGIGPCNREYCCHTFLCAKESVTVKDAKCQRLDINPQKITGMCGKLMCCLKYEVDVYREYLKDFPEDGETVLYKDWHSKVLSVNPFLQTISILIPEEYRIETVKLADLKRMFHGQWIPCDGSSELMSQQKAERAKEAMDNAEKAKFKKKKKVVKPAPPWQSQSARPQHERQDGQQHRNPHQGGQGQPGNPS